MSQENVAIIRRAAEARQRGEQWAEVLGPEFEWDSSAYPGLDIPVRGRGTENFLRFLDRYRRAWIDYEWATKELLDAGDDVVMVVHETARAKGTEMLIERDLVMVWTMRKGRAIRMRGYGTRQEALEAVGLRDERGSRESAERDLRWVRNADLLRRRLE
jgi:ketosteroid isomerase-like protein